LSGFVAYRHTVLNYDDDTEDDYQVYNPTIGVEKRFSENARISIGVGYYFQNNDESDDESDFNVDSEIFKRWDYRSAYIDVIGSSGYEIDDNGVEDNGLRIYYAGGIGLGYRFSPKFSSNIFSSYRYDDYPNSADDRVDQSINAGAGLEWQMLQWMSSKLTYNFERVTSDIDANEYTENSILLTITMMPSSPFRLN
jgi:hypothetical protein